MEPDADAILAGDVSRRLEAVGEELKATGDTKGALDRYDDCMARAREIKDGELRSAVELTVLSGLGNAHYAEGDFRRAKAAHARALALSRSLGDRESEGSDLCNLGAAHLALGEARSTRMIPQRCDPRAVIDAVLTSLCFCLYLSVSLSVSL